MQVHEEVFFLNLEKNSADPSCRFRDKHKSAHFISENDVTEPKARLLLITS